MLTMATEYLAAIARMSAQDNTGAGLVYCRLDVIHHIESLAELRLGMTVFSPRKLVVSFNKIDPSQP